MSHDKPEKFISKVPRKRLKPTVRNVLIPAFLFVVLLILVLFVQKQQVIRQWAATNPQANAASCSTAQFYCLILGGKKTCTLPSVCPPPPPQPKFVPQSNQNANSSQSPNSSQNPNTNTNPNQASGSAQSPNGAPAPASKSTCTTAPAILTTKLIIHFDTDVGSNNGYTIRSVDMPALNNYAASLKQNPTATVTINGYTDSVQFAAGTTGKITNNQQLSLARAQAAENYLKSKGATKNTYIIKGDGATNFVAPNNAQTGNLLNRRDEITTNLNAGSCTAATNALIMSNVTATTNNGTGDYCLSNTGGIAAINRCNASDATQQWDIKTNGTITNNNKCLDVANNQTANGSKVIVATCNGAKSQQWSVQTMATGPATGQTEILNKQANKCLGDPGFSTAYGLQQQLGTCNGTDNLSWITDPSALGSSIACLDKSQKDSYYAGYLFPAPANTTKLTVSGEWVVNTFACRNGDNSYSQWPGIGNYKNGDLAQVGSYNMCINGTVSYNNPWTMAFPAPFVDPPKTDIIKVHDTMYASIQMTKPGTFNTVLQDKTQGWTYKRTMTYTGSNWTADYNGFILEAEGNDAHASHPTTPIYPLPKFNDAYYENLGYSINGGATMPLGKAPQLYCDSSGYLNGSNYIIQDMTSPIRSNNFYVSWRNYK